MKLRRRRLPPVPDRDVVYAVSCPEMRCAWPSETRDLRSTSSPRVSADSIWSSPFYTQSGPGISNAATTDRRIGHRRSLISFKHVGLSLPPRSPLPPPLALLLHPWTLIGRVLLASQGAQVVDRRTRARAPKPSGEKSRHREDVVDVLPAGWSNSGHRATTRQPPSNSGEHAHVPCRLMIACHVSHGAFSRGQHWHLLHRRSLVDHRPTSMPRPED